MKRGGAMEDRRLRRTRERLRESLLELLGEKDIRAVTVKELTDRADVNRGTFYSHYQDIYDMLDQLEAEVFGEFTALLDAYTQADLERGLEPILRDVFCFVDRHAGLCLRLMAGDQENAFFQRLRQEIHRRRLDAPVVRRPPFRIGENVERLDQSPELLRFLRRIGEQIRMALPGLPVIGLFQCRKIAVRGNFQQFVECHKKKTAERSLFPPHGFRNDPGLFTYLRSAVLSLPASRTERALIFPFTE